LGFGASRAAAPSATFQQGFSGPGIEATRRDFRRALWVLV